MHSVSHDGFPRPAAMPARPFDHYAVRRRHPVPHSFGPSSVAGFVRQNMNAGGSPRLRGVPGSTYRVPGPGGPVVGHGDYISQSPRPSVSHYHLEYSQGGVPASWAGPPALQGVQMPAQPGQDKWLGPPPPMYAVQQSPGHAAAEAFPSSPMYAQYSPQVAPPPNYGTSQPQYSPAVAPPTQQLFVVANTPVVAPPPSSQFAAGGQPPYQFGFVPAGQPVASQVPVQPQQEVSSAGPGCVVGGPPQQYVVANQPLVVPAAPANHPYVAQQYAKAAPANVMPQQVIMMSAQQYVVSPPPQPGVPAPAAGQLYSVVANQSAAPRPGGPPQCVVQPVMAGQRMPIHVAAVPNQYQPIAVPANQLQVLPTNQMQPMAVGHLQVLPANALQVVSTSQPPPPTVPANQMQSLATSQQAPPQQPVFCYLPSASVATPAGSVPPVNSDLGPSHMKGASAVQQQPAATAVIQVSVVQVL